MCSGCSGDFEGEGDDQGFGGNEPLEHEAERPDGILREAGVAGWTRSGLPNTRAGVDDYEVLVSSEQIVERRTIPANYPAINREAAKQTTETWQGRRPQS